MPDAILDALIRKHSHGETFDVVAFGRAVMAVERAACADACRRVATGYSSRAAAQAAEYCALQIEQRT